MNGLELQQKQFLYGREMCSKDLCCGYKGSEMLVLRTLYSSLLMSQIIDIMKLEFSKNQRSDAVTRCIMRIFPPPAVQLRFIVLRLESVRSEKLIFQNKINLKASTVVTAEKLVFK
jgi:hypothetical protein